MTRSLSRVACAAVLRQRAYNFVILCAVIFLTGPGAQAAAQTDDWLDADKLARLWSTPIGGFRWTGRPLREGADTLSRNLTASRRVAIVLDRRVDPGQLVDFQVSGRSLADSMQLLAEQLQLGVTRLGSIIYIGPKQSARRLRTLAALRADESHALAPVARRRLERIGSTQWAELATPREIISGMAAEGGVRLEGIERIPHDLWPAGALPPASLVDRLTVIANQFDLTFRMVTDGDSLELAPIQPPVVLVRRYTLGALVEPAAMRVAELVPEAGLSVDGGVLIVTGRDEDHEVIRDILSGRNPSRGGSDPPAEARSGAGTRPPSPTTGVTLTVQNKSLAEVLSALEAQLGISFQWELADGPDRQGYLNRLVSVQLRHTPVDDVLSSILRPLGLTFTRRDLIVTLRPINSP